MARPHIEPFVDRDVHFKKMPLPGFGKGMHYKMLSIDEDTGACTMTVQFDGGYKQPPSISESDIELMILEGGLQVGEEQCGPGHYFFVPKGVALPAISTKNGCRGLLMYNDCEPNLIESDQDATGAERDQFIHVAAYDDMPWQVPTLFPQTASGCLLKLLRFDEKTHAMTFLYTMTPGFQQDNISYHDCAEEAYHIWGTSWMMQFGDLPTGGYFWRPPYINHGAFASDHGILGFGRTDGELHNHFHFNPWTDPEENLERVAARLHRQKPELFKWLLTHDHNHIPTDFEYPEEAVLESDHEHVDENGQKYTHKHR
jgi:hypothetical protein